MLKKSAFTFSLLFSSLQISFAQNYPAYTINVCDSTSSGYYFLCAIDVSQFSNIPPTQMILDSTGKTIYYKICDHGGGDFKLQPNGLISYDYANKFFLLDSTFTIVDSVECLNGINTDGHDLQILPNGHFLLLGYENVVMDLSAYNMFGNFHTLPGDTNAIVKCGVIPEQDANHNVVFEWHTKDHFAFADVDPYWLNGPHNVDWNHCNAIELDNDGNILLSVRHFDEITKINRSDSSIIWRLGGNANQFTFPNDPAKFKGQHDIRRIANGNITLWDNGYLGPPYHAGYAKEYSIDDSLMTATLVWNYLENANCFSRAVGNVQRLSNGNTLIDYGITTSENRLFDVVDPAANKIFEIEFADTLRSYRAFDFLTMPWQLPRPVINCVTIGNQSYLDAGAGHTKYLWSTGDTTQMIPVTAADTFSVFVSIGAGGFIRSENFIVTNINYPCSPAGIENANLKNTISLFPDPAENEIFIQSSFTENKKVDVEIFDFTGRKVSSEEIIPQNNQIALSIVDLPKGIYFMRVNSKGEKFVKN